MRVNPIYAYNRFIPAQKNKQVSFGLIENEENTKRVLPKNSDYRIPFDTQWQYLKDHDAVTVTSEGNKAWARINAGFEKMYNLLNYENLDKPNYLVDLEDQDQFDSFYRRLTFIDNDRQGIKVSGGCFIDDNESAYDRATKDGFGVKVD